MARVVVRRVITPTLKTCGIISSPPLRDLKRIPPSLF
ncbi:hypothetical protein Bcell_3365 [Evansella cellulosilytica DSM 2522]|uniref:Uncharacterized protein n=1 Tax=Evansella cellulosilytica (strain ATCC 21833 / DSM 2522 / FERM P-1141 / JCM 9156 / N-4) TaxID=649639 RepID=E6U1W0_EVAC2|nr:hypothetical protein Bcell_3365 [Evansella cellulosilytica DSM 2522]